MTTFVGVKLNKNNLIHILVRFALIEDSDMVKPRNKDRTVLPVSDR